MSNTEIVLLRETLLESILSDTYTFLCIAALFLLNHNLCGDSRTIYVICTVLFIFTLFLKKQKKYSPVEAKEIIENIIKENQKGVR